MKIIADVEKKVLKILENERSVFKGEYNADKLELYINKELTSEYPTITALLSNGRKIGPYTPDGSYENVTIDGVKYTKADFTLSYENGFTLSEGKMQITIWLNNINGKKEALGNVTLNVINTTAYNGGDIIISDDVTGTITNFRVELDNLQGQINTFNGRLLYMEEFMPLIAETTFNFNELNYDELVDFYEKERNVILETPITTNLFNKPVNLGDKFASVGITKDKRIIQFVAEVTTLLDVSSISFKFTSLILLGQDIPILNKTIKIVAKTDDFSVGKSYMTTTEFFDIIPRTGKYFFASALLKPTKKGQPNAFVTFKAFVTEIIDDYEIFFEIVDVDIIYDSKKVVSVDKEQTITATKYFNDESGYEIEINPNECQVLLTDVYNSYNRITPHNISMNYEGREEVYLSSEEQVLQFRNSDGVHTEYSHSIYHKKDNVSQAVILEFPENSGTIATEEYVDNKIANLVNSAPETLDTLGEVAQALQENDSVVDALNSAISNKVDKTYVDEKLGDIQTLLEAI